MLMAICLVTGFATPRFGSNRTVVIQFKHRVGNKELVLFDETYTNRLGEPFVINKFRYYISSLVVTGANGTVTKQPDIYYLVNEADSLSKIITLPLNARIQSISFVIGVDSIRNVSGVQTGSLDPANGMFWTWNSGYVFAKLEGQSDISRAAAHSFTWDVGGFRQRENALRTVKLNVNGTQRSDTIVVNADILKWFDAVHPLSIAQTPTCHQPGKLAMQIADNYSAMFSVAP